MKTVLTPFLPFLDVHLWCASLDAPQTVVEQYAATLAPDEQQRAARFRAGTLRNRFIVGRGTLRAILARYLDADAAQPTFQYNALGKPALAAPWDQSGLRFNVSHSHGLALFAVASGREVGVDVEWPQRRCDPAKLIHRYFSEVERREWHALPAEQKLAGFFRGWTCKEAWLKAVGTGLSFPLDQVSVSLAPSEPPRLLSIRGDRDEAAQWHLACSIPADGYVAAVAVRGAAPHINSWQWE